MTLIAITEPGAVVADVARREDVSPRLVYKWRLGGGRSAPLFADFRR
jgi:transposase